MNFLRCSFLIAIALIATLLDKQALAATPAASAAASRFSGSATLEAPPATSADGRFTVTAELLPGDRPQTGARFALDARLDASAEAKSTLTVAAADGACSAGGDFIFFDGFE